MKLSCSILSVQAHEPQKAKQRDGVSLTAKTQSQYAKHMLP